MSSASVSNQIQAFYDPSISPLSASAFLADPRVLSSVIIMPLMTFIFVRFVIFLDGAGMNVLKAKIARMRRKDTSHLAFVAPAYGPVSPSPGDAPGDDDVLAEAAKISAGNVDANVPILAQNLTKTFVDESSGLEIKAVQGVSFEVPLSQVVKQRVTCHTSHVTRHASHVTPVITVLRLPRPQRRRQKHHHRHAVR